MAFLGDCLQMMQLAHKDQCMTSGRLYKEHLLAVVHIYRPVPPDDLVGQGVCLFTMSLKILRLLWGSYRAFWGDM